MSADGYTQIAIYWLFALILAGGGLITWANSGQRSHLWFVARHVGLTIAVSVATVIDHLPSIVVIVAFMALNVLSYNPIITRSRRG